MLQLQEILLTTPTSGGSSSSSSSHSTHDFPIHDLRSGALLGTLKGSPSPIDTNVVSLVNHPNVAAGLDRVVYVVAGFKDRASLGVWSFQKDHLLHKFNLPTTTPLTSLHTSPNGVYLAGGTKDGKIFVWELFSGKLLRMLDCHFGKVNVVRFTNDSVGLVSGGEDGVVKVFLLSSLCDHHQTTQPTPYQTWNDHSLAITDIRISTGNLHTSRIFTSSLDRTVKLWNISSCPNKPLATFLFPTSITCLLPDATETHFFAGGQDGFIYKTKLYQNLGLQDDTLYPFQPTHATSTNLTDITTLLSRKIASVLKGHHNAVTSLSLSFDNALLISTSLDGKVLIWDPYSGSCVRKQETSPAVPITNGFVFMKPLEYLNPSAGKYKLPVLATLKRVQEVVDGEEGVVTVYLKGNDSSNRNAYRSEELVDSAQELMMKNVDDDERVNVVNGLRRDKMVLEGFVNKLMDMNGELYDVSVGKLGGKM